MYHIIIFIIIVIIILFCLNDKMSFNISSSTNNNINDVITTLIRQSSRWSLAAEQDENPLVAVLHANYGAAYLWALKDITTSEKIKEATGVDLIKFENKIKEIQDKTTTKLAKLCPEYAGESDEYLAAIAGHSI